MSRSSERNRKVSRRSEEVRIIIYLGSNLRQFLVLKHIFIPFKWLNHLGKNVKFKISLIDICLKFYENIALRQRNDRFLSSLYA
jgi:hypothetical protein